MQIWLVNHTCNPFIYAYFNDRMRLTYGQLMTCSQLRYEISKRRVSHTFTQGRHTSRYFLCILAHYGKNSLMEEFPNDEVTRNGDILYNSLDGGPQLRGQEERESSLEREWEKREFGLLFCRRSNGQKTNRMSTRSNRGTRDGNFVRNSLQMQSRDFEQLCEFMMRVNPFYDSSEGWRESSDEEEERPVC